MQERIRNIAIIAHVDHGKTTLVDAMLKHSGVYREHEAITERVMDSNDLEKERGITILAKNLSIHHGQYKINIVDTPGHADFGGEVERVLKMVDSVLLLVDALDGPMPQTRFVLKKSLDLGLKPIVVINKIDRPGSRPDEVLNMVFDLFCELEANDEQLDFPVVYTSAKMGYAKLDVNVESNSMEPLFAVVESNVRPPKGDANAPFQMLVTNIDYNDYIGRIATGRIFNGKVKAGETVAMIKQDGAVTRAGSPSCWATKGSKQVEIQEAGTGDIVTVAGFDEVSIGETLASAENPGGRALRLHRRADPVDELHRQHLPLCRPRRQMGHLPQHPRATDQGTAHQRLAAGRRHRFTGYLQDLRPGRAAPVDPDREHAPRRIRTGGLQAGGHHPRKGRRQDGADGIPGGGCGL